MPSCGMTLVSACTSRVFVPRFRMLGVWRQSQQRPWKGGCPWTLPIIRSGTHWVLCTAIQVSIYCTGKYMDPLFIPEFKFANGSFLVNLLTRCSSGNARCLGPFLRKILVRHLAKFHLLSCHSRYANLI